MVHEKSQQRGTLWGSVQTASWASVRERDSKHKVPSKAMQYVNTSERLNSEVSSTVKGGGKKPKLGKVSTYRSPNSHLSMMWHLRGKWTSFCFWRKNIPCSERSILLLYPAQEVKPRPQLCNWGHMDVPALALKCSAFTSHITPGESWAEVPKLLRNSFTVTLGE